MDPSATSEEFTCDICLEAFGNGSKCPRLLSCGHCYCHSCLKKLLAQCQFCPKCKAQIKYLTADSIPINLPVRNFMSKFNVKNENQKNNNSPPKSADKEVTEPKGPRPKPVKLPSEGFCTEHNNFRELRCMNCELWICSMCATLNHKDCRTLLFKEAFNEMKNCVSETIEEVLNSQIIRKAHLSNALKKLEERKTITMKEIEKFQSQLFEIKETISTFRQLESDQKQAYKTLTHLKETILNSRNDSEFENSKMKLDSFVEELSKTTDQLSIPDFPLTFHDLKCWSNRDSVYVLHDKDNKPKYGRVTTEERKIWVHSFQFKEPKNILKIISFDELCSSVNTLAEPPHTQRAFLTFRMMKEGSGAEVFSVVIRTSNFSDRERNFLLLCSGIKERSYIGTEFSTSWNGFTGMLPEISPVVEAIIGCADCGETPWKRGTLWGMDDSNSLFSIWMKDDPSQSLINVFGEVEMGLYHLEKARRQGTGLSVVDCGLVFEAS